MASGLLRITPQESASPDDFKTAVQPLNDFLLQVEAIKESDIPKLTYPGSARLTCNVIWHLAGCLHCKRALSAVSPMARKPHIRVHLNGPTTSISWARRWSRCLPMRSISKAVNAAGS